MTDFLAQIVGKKRLLVSYIAYSIMLLNSVFLSSSVIGIGAFVLFALTIVLWLAEIYGRSITAVNFLIGCFILLSIVIIVLGLDVYLMIFSSLTVWVFLMLVPSLCYFVVRTTKIERTEQKNDTTHTTGFNYSLRRLGLVGSALSKVSILVTTCLFGFLVGLASRTGYGISHIEQTVSFIFWPILGFSFFMVYLIWKEEKLGTGPKLVSMFLAAFLVFGAPLLIYRNYVTEDSFGLLGVVRSIIQTGIYGWVPHLGRTGYYALFSFISVSSSTQMYVQILYKLIPPVLVSIYVPLFTYLLLERITGKKHIFVALTSLLFFPTVIFLSIPLDKSVATVFFMGSLWFSFLILDDAIPKKANIIVLCLTLVATPFLHDYFGLFCFIPLILGLFLRLPTFKNPRRLIPAVALMIFVMGTLIPFSFVLDSYILRSSSPTVFSFPNLDSVASFLIPTLKFPASSALDVLPYVYSDNFVWVRYGVLFAGILTLWKSNKLFKHKETKIWLIAIVLAFLLGYFLLKTSTQNPPEAAKDYRFGFFVDLSLVPLAGIVLNEALDKASHITIVVKLPSITKKLSSISFKSQSLVVTILVFIVVVSVFCGFNFDGIMERPTDAQGIGRYVVTDEKLQAVQYIQNKTGSQKYVVLSDSHMGQIAQGFLDLNFAGAELFNLNGGGALYSYFDTMRRSPSRALMDELMNKTKANVGFFVIGLGDWRGWQPSSAYWIDSNAVEKLKSIADEWIAFGENNDLFVFVFQKL